MRKAVTSMFGLFLVLSACFIPPTPIDMVPFSYEQDITGIAWSPDGKEIVFSYSNHFEKDGEFLFHEYLYKMPVANPIPELIFENKDEDLDFGLIQWHPKKQAVLLQGGDNVYEFDLNTLQLKTLLDRPVAGLNDVCYSSPEGHLIVSGHSLFHATEASTDIEQGQFPINSE